MSAPAAPTTAVTSAGTRVDDLDLLVARRLCDLAGVADAPALVAAAALAVAAPRGGHVCVDLDDVTAPVVGRQRGGAGRNAPAAANGDPADDAAGSDDIVLDVLPDVEVWRTALLATPLARPGDDDRTTPLVVDGSRVYLDRYWAYEERLRAAVLARSADVGPPADPAVVTAVLDRVAPHDAPGPNDPPCDRQRLAVASALLRPLTVLSGGPGTGKTHTLVSALAGHVLLAAERDLPTPRIAIAAPTGKAAARMEQAVREALAGRDLPDEVTAALSGLRGATLHRLLGYRPDAPTRFRHTVDDPLPHDVVVVDEASMVPLSLMAKFVAAVAPDATLLLVGDRDQLTSVEAGAVLGDLCGPAPTGSSLRLSDGWARVLADVTGEPVDVDRAVVPGPGVWDGIVQLERFRRFGAASGIGAVARAIRATTSDAGRVVDLLTGAAVEPGADVDAYADATLVAPATVVGAVGLPASVRADVVAASRPYLDAALAGDAPTALDRLDDVRVLCATRSGPLGVDQVGRAVERWLSTADPRLRAGAGEWYAGRPVMVTRNDHDLGLMNGDVGVTIAVDGRHVVAFPTSDGDVRTVAAVRMPPHETVWAMTIHKSQGSQFRHAVVVLPHVDTRVVSRELVYTGVTRASERVTVVADEQRLREAVLRPVRRATGLADRLWPAVTP